MLATQHSKLVAQHQDLDLLGLCRPTAEHDQLKDAAQRQVDERPDNGHLQRKANKRRRIMPYVNSDPLVTGTLDFWHPTGLRHGIREPSQYLPMPPESTGQRPDLSFCTLRASETGQRRRHTTAPRTSKPPARRPYPSLCTPRAAPTGSPAASVGSCAARTQTCARSGILPTAAVLLAMGEPELAHDLSEPMQRLLGVLPLGQWHRGDSSMPTLVSVSWA